MGREDIATCHWQGEIAEVRLHLDSAELTLRGEIRATIARSEIATITPCDVGLRVGAASGDLIMEMNPQEAIRWQKALLKTPPTLAEKLGVSAQTPAYVFGDVKDDALAKALENAVAKAVADAAILVALIEDTQDLDSAAKLAQDHPGMHLWAVYRKGKAAVVGDTMIRKHMRALGFIDSKSSAVSDQLTATRYRKRDP